MPEQQLTFREVASKRSASAGKANLPIAHFAPVVHIVSTVVSCLWRCPLTFTFFFSLAL